jgi:aspartate beta-hydroxylase
MNAHENIEELRHQAADAARRGDMVQAEALWTRLFAQAPDDPDTLFALGFHAQMKGQLELAITRFRGAIEYSPANPLLRLTIANALKAVGDTDGHFVGLMAALDCDPYFVPAHFQRAKSLIEIGRIGEATQAYRDILKIVGPKENWPTPFASDLAAAVGFVEGQAHLAKKAYLSALELPKKTEPLTDWGRLTEAAAILSGSTKAFNQEPVMLHVPRLPAIPFYDNDAFDWTQTLQAQSGAIVRELVAGAKAAADMAAPYVAYAPGVPVNQWRELNHSTRWSAVFFYKNGAEIAETHARFPATSAILKSLPLADITGFCPNVMFSTLAPKSVIPPHTGETNARLVVHLPLIVPDRCRYRVGNEWRIWEVGKPLIFDDSIEHEAINDSDEPRVVLIFDIWNPYLSTAEREGVRQLLDVRNKLLADAHS